MSVESQKSHNIENIQRNIYPVEIFLKYKNANREDHSNFIKYYENNQNKKYHDMLEKQEYRVKLNYIITKKNISNEDMNIYNTIRGTLNKVNNKMLTTESPNLTNTIATLTSINYTKVEHFEKLCEIIMEKAINEPKYSSIYAIICMELSQYYIEIGAKEIRFRAILITLCETIFDTCLRDFDKTDKEKITGLLNFLAELYNKQILPTSIIIGCFDRICKVIDNAPHMASGISSLICTSYATILAEQERKQPINKPSDYILNKLKSHIEDENIHKRSKITLLNIIESLEVITQKHKNKKN